MNFGNQEAQYHKNRELKLNQKLGRVPMMKANIDPSEEIKVQDKGLIHVRLTRKVNNKAKKVYEEFKHIAKFHPRIFNKTDRKGNFSFQDILKREFDSQDIVHDPARGETVDVKHEEVGKHELLDAPAGNTVEDQLNSVYTRDQLEPLDIFELREVAAPFGVKSTAKDKLIDKILEAQSTI